MGSDDPVIPPGGMTAQPIEPVRIQHLRQLNLIGGLKQPLTPGIPTQAGPQGNHCGSLQQGRQLFRPLHPPAHEFRSTQIDRIRMLCVSGDGDQPGAAAGPRLRRQAYRPRVTGSPADQQQMSEITFVGRAPALCHQRALLFPIDAPGRQQLSPIDPRRDIQGIESDLPTALGTLPRKHALLETDETNAGLGPNGGSHYPTVVRV